MERSISALSALSSLFAAHCCTLARCGVHTVHGEYLMIRMHTEVLLTTLCLFIQLYIGMLLHGETVMIKMQTKVPLVPVDPFCSSGGVHCAPAWRAADD